MDESRCMTYIKQDKTVLRSAAGSILGTIGQQITLPLFIGAIGGDSGVYFILLFCSLMFNVVFWPISLYRWRAGHITQQVLDKTKMWKIVIIGVFDALNGFLMVYSSVLNRTPGPLQAILGQSVIPFTMLLSVPILKKTYNRGQYLGAGLTLVGIVLSLIPVFIHFSIAGHGPDYWPFLFLIGNIPGVLMNIYEEDVFRDTLGQFDIYLMLAAESFFQVVTVLALFWLDIVPGFGTSKTLLEVEKGVRGGFGCFFNPVDAMDPERCSYSSVLGILFTVFYCFSYVYGAIVMKHASANANAFATGLSPVFVVVFWIAFPALNAWAGGHPYTAVDLVCYLVALPLLAVGVAIYRYEEKQKDSSSVNNDYAPITD